MRTLEPGPNKYLKRNHFMDDKGDPIWDQAASYDECGAWLRSGRYAHQSLRSMGLQRDLPAILERLCVLKQQT